MEYIVGRGVACCGLLCLHVGESGEILHFTTEVGLEVEGACVGALECVVEEPRRWPQADEGLGELYCTAEPAREEE
jgi:hypothetical protein